MCDQTEVTYADGDVVWVKIKSIWWPGVVTDLEKDEEGQEILSGLRKKPIAAVKFFNESNYEFVYSLENIYHYNCRKKEEFIKKGLDKFRTGATHMVKFPNDIREAEILVGGNPDIIEDPIFAPPEKAKYDDVFGSVKKKPKKKEEQIVLKSNIIAIKKRYSSITPNRRVTVRPTLKPGETFRLVSKTLIYYCPLCPFTAKHVEVISNHFSYIHTSKRVNFGSEDGHYVSKPKPKPATPAVAKTVSQMSAKKKGRPSKTLKRTPTVKDATPKKIPTKRPAASTEKSPEIKKRFTDALIADWSEDDELLEDTCLGKEKREEKTIDTERTAPLNETPVKKVSTKSGTATVKGAVDAKKDSPFDFDEEDGFIGMSNANTYGRKIPRVIPVKDKTDLGMDLEIDELFKAKDEEKEENAESVEAEVAVPAKKKGRVGRKQSANTESSGTTDGDANVSKKAIPETLASTRARRPGARRSYLNEVIEKIDDDGNIIRSDESEMKPSRRKQDLKKQSLSELDDLDLLSDTKKAPNTPIKKSTLAEIDDPDIIPEVKKSPITPSRKPNLSELANLDIVSDKKEPSKVIVIKKPNIIKADNFDIVQKAKESPHKPTFSNILISPREDLESKKQIGSKLPVVVNKEESKPRGSEDISSIIEYLEEEVSKPEVLVTSPIKPKGSLVKINSLPEEVDASIVKKVNLSQWKQELSEKLKPKRASPAGETSAILKDLPRTKVVKYITSKGIVKSGNMAGKYLVVNPRTTTSLSSFQGLKVTGPSSGVQGSNKIILASPKRAPKIVGYYKNDNVLVFKGTQGGTPGRALSIRKTIDKSDGDSLKYVCKVGDGTPKYVLPQSKVRLPITRVATPSFKQVKTTNLLVGVKPEQEAVLLKSGNEVLPPSTSQATVNSQIVALPGPVGADGKETTIYVTLGQDGEMQVVDDSLISYSTPTEDTSSNIETVLINTAETAAPTYTVGQDILAEALANTNVLESETSIPTYIISQESVKPILAPLGTDSGLLIAPVVHETSINLQTPIMTAAEVPSAVVPDTSDFKPPPLPPTPTEEDVMEEGDGDLTVVEEQPEQQAIESHEIIQQGEGDYFIDDSQEGSEQNGFQSMPLLNEETAVSEEPIGDQNFVVQEHVDSEYLPTSTNPELEQQEARQENEDAFPQEEDGKEERNPDEDPVRSMPFITEEGFVVEGDSHPSQETEVSSTTGDSKDSVS